MSVPPSGLRACWNTFSPASVSLLKDPSASVKQSLENTPTCILLPQIILVKSAELVVLKMSIKCSPDWFPNSVAAICRVRHIFSRKNYVCVCDDKREREQGRETERGSDPGRLFTPCLVEGQKNMGINWNRGHCHWTQESCSTLSAVKHLS